MNFIFSFKYLFLSLILLVISCKPVEKIIDTNFKKQVTTPEIKSLENEEEILISSDLIETDFSKKYYLEKIKHSRHAQSKLETFIYNNELYTLNENSEIFVHNYDNGKLIKKYHLFQNEKNDKLIANYFKKNNLILAYNSGTIIKTDLNGNVIWKFDNSKIFNSFIYEFNNIIIILYGDEIIGLNFENGKKLWSEKYENLPIIQAKGGKIRNFFNNIYFVLPNGRLGSVDLYIGSRNNDQFVNLELQSSINNAKDKIYLFKNFLVYLDEGEFMYTYDILNDEFLLYNYKINSSSSNYFYNNALILKNDNYFEALNILNGNSFWLIDSEINKKSKILNIANYKKNLAIFLNNGKVIIMKDNEIIQKIDIKLNKINSLIILKDKILAHLENGKIGIF